MFNNMLEKYKNSNSKKKIENIIYLVIMLVLIVLGINYIWFNNDIVSNNNETIPNEVVSTMNKESIYNDELEKRLENILAKVKGVSDVSVLITYTNDIRIIPVYNEENKETITNETDSAGGDREVNEKEYKKEVVFEENSNVKSAIIETKVNPTISGIIVVANYNNDITIKQQIVTAVSTIANISEYKVQVLMGG